MRHLPIYAAAATALLPAQAYACEEMIFHSTFHFFMSYCVITAVFGFFMTGAWLFCRAVFRRPALSPFYFWCAGALLSALSMLALNLPYKPDAGDLATSFMFCMVVLGLALGVMQWQLRTSHAEIYENKARKIIIVAWVMLPALCLMLAELSGPTTSGQLKRIAVSVCALVVASVIARVSGSFVRKASPERRRRRAIAVFAALFIVCAVVLRFGLHDGDGHGRGVIYSMED
jgi:hypothetical protein